MSSRMIWTSLNVLPVAWLTCGAQLVALRNAVGCGCLLGTPRAGEGLRAAGSTARDPRGPAGSRGAPERASSGVPADLK